MFIPKIMSFWMKKEVKDQRKKIGQVTRQNKKSYVTVSYKVVSSQYPCSKKLTIGCVVKKIMRKIMARL